MKRITTTVASLAASALVVAGLGAANPASAVPAHAGKTGTKSLVKVLGADGVKFDKNWQDFDITEAAVLAVLDADPNSPVGLLADGKTRLTLFLPTDAAFRALVKDATGTKPKTEAATVEALLGLVDVKTIETVLLYHVVPGKTLDSKKVVAAAKKGTKLTTAQGGTVKVTDKKGNLVLVDKDPDLKDPTVILNGVDINKGNRQIAHAIDRVLLPVNL
jgi:hypothetical protein